MEQAISKNRDNRSESQPTNLTFHDTSNHSIGKYGRLRKRYLEEHQPALYTQMIQSGKLMKHLAETEQGACNRATLLVTAMAKQEGVTEALKAENQLEWVSRMNSIQNRVDEIVLHELIYE